MSGYTPVISFEDATICNAENPVIYEMDMEILPGDFTYIIGKVGTGKTSIIRTIIAENSIREGSGRVCGYNLNTIKSKDIPMLRRRLGIVFQDFQLLMDRSVYDNLEFVLKCTGWRNKDEISQRIGNVLESVGMENKAHRMPFRLSGGEQQRIAIARALLNEPEVIIADEPTGNLDAETADGIMKILKTINSMNGTAIVMVTHNEALVKRYPGRIFVCENERCREIPPESIETESAETELAATD